MWRLLLVSLILAASSASAAAEQACRPLITVDDAPGDVAVQSRIPFDSPPLDILRYEIEQANDSLILRLTLAEKPGARENEYYRYWLGFEFTKDNKTWHYMDLRISATETYDTGNLVAPGSMGSPRLATDLPVTWEGTTMRANLSLAFLEEALGTGLTWGLPAASSDGIHRRNTGQGVVGAAPYIQDDSNNLDEEYELIPCPPAVSVVSSAPVPPGEAQTPWPVALTLLALLAVAWMRKPR